MSMKRCFAVLFLLSWALVIGCGGSDLEYDSNENAPAEPSADPSTEVTRDL